MTHKRSLKFSFLSIAPAPVWRKHLRYRVHAILQELGTPGVLGLSLIAFCVMVWGTVILKQSVERETIEAELRADAPPVDDQRRAAEQQAELSAFNADLQKESELATLLGQLHAFAEAAGVRLAHSEFHHADSGAAAVAVVPMVIVTLDLKANHEQTMQFVNHVLAQRPNSALETITLKRPRVADTVLETQLRFRFYVRTS